MHTHERIFYATRPHPGFMNQNAREVTHDHAAAGQPHTHAPTDAPDAAGAPPLPLPPPLDRNDAPEGGYAAR